MNELIFRDSERISGMEGEIFDSKNGVYLKCTFEGENLEGANLQDSVFIDCIFQNSSLYWSTLSFGKFIQCRFYNLDLRGAFFTESHFLECEIKDCDFGKDNMGSATEISEAVFKDCIFSNNNEFPI